MHVLDALAGIRAISQEAQRGMVGPKLTNEYLGQFAMQYRLLMRSLESARAGANRPPHHPIIDRFEAWYQARVAALIDGPEDNVHWGKATTALGWIDHNAAAVDAFLRTYGDVTQQTDDTTHEYHQRDPRPGDCGTDGGVLRKIWNDTATSFRKRGIPMDDWKGPETAKLFLMKTGRPSHRAKILVDTDQDVRGFLVREVLAPRLHVRHVGIVSGKAKKSVEALSVGHAILDAAYLQHELAEPLLINLELPQPAHPAQSPSGMADDVVI